MNRLLLIALFIGLIGWISCGPETDSNPPTLAVASIYATEEVGENVYQVTTREIGSAIFKEENGIVTLTINATNLDPNSRHAIHLHEGTCESPGIHWNQGGQANFCRELNMGEAWVRPNAGDVGNIRTDISGSGTFEISTEFWKLGSNDNFDIAGLVIVLHADEEDFAQECFDAHDHAHNNPKIACGTIQLIIND